MKFILKKILIYKIKKLEKQRDALLNEIVNDFNKLKKDIKESENKYETNN